MEEKLNNQVIRSTVPSKGQDELESVMFPLCLEAMIVFQMFKFGLRTIFYLLLHSLTIL